MVLAVCVVSTTNIALALPIRLESGLFISQS